MDTFINPFFLSALLLIVYMSFVFVFALYMKDNGIVDIGYGLAFVLVAATTLYNYGEHPLGGLLTLFVSVWGLRLAIRIHERHRGKPEDFRYAKWRGEWKWFKTRSFLQIYMLQGAVVFLVVLPVVFANAYFAPIFSTQSIILEILGAIIWLKGFFFEAVGDYQLDRFSKNPANKGQLIQTGLWKYTRHPNYFGESLMWWGIWVAALPAILPFGPLAAIGTLIASPILITFLLLKVSGVPMMERAMSARPGWEDYAHRTSMFVPWWPRK